MAPKPKPSPEQILKAAVMLMESVAAQLQPAEVQRVQQARAILESRQQFPRELGLLLQQDYMRLRTTQMHNLDALEEAAPYLFPQELEMLHAARVSLESGRFIPDDLCRQLGAARMRTSLPQILEGLNAQHPLLSDEENVLVQQALLDLNLTGQVHPNLQQKILRLQQNIVHRQHMGMI